jgi:CHAT domain-containing protein/tetratricopeptide (TPR) repeat protein
MRLGWLPLLALAGCARTASDATLYQDGCLLLRSEHYKEAAAKADLGLRRAACGSPAELKFRLLKATILLGQNEANQAADVLCFHLPPGSQSTDLARCQLYKGRAALTLGDLSQAASRLRQAQALAAKEPGLLTEIKLQQGVLAARTRSPEAESLLRDVLDYASRHGDEFLQTKATNAMGYMLLQASRFEQAIPWFEKAQSASQKLGLADSEARAKGNLEWCYYRLGDYGQALDYAQQAAAGAERADDRSDWQKWLGNTGSIDLEQRNYHAAQANYQRALAVARALKEPSSIAACLNNLAKLFIETGDCDSAERYNQEALTIKREIRDGRSEMYSLNNAARIAACRKDYAVAEANFRSVISSPSTDPVPLLDAHAGLAQVLGELHRGRDAEAEFKATVAIVESQIAEHIKDKYKLTDLDSFIHFYQNYVEFLMAGGRTLDALEVAESSRARLLFDKMKLASTRRSHTAADFRRLAGIYQSTLLSYWVAPARSYLWAITPTGISVFTLPPESALRDLVSNYDALIQYPRDPLTVENPAGQKLYDALIAPARKLLPKTGRVMVTPDGPLYSLNFETLPVSGDKPHYFIEDATVSITPALTLLSPDRLPSAPAHSLLLIGNPVYDGTRFRKLDYAGQEMSAIQHGLPGFHTVAFEGAQAQPEAYTDAGPGRFALIHFVAHASADRVDPLQSAVILSPQGSNYTLRASDVMKTPLQADLVTVSACRSAGARTYGGEGLVGFSWAFLEAGAHSVIAGLWDVNDRSTAELMARLYQGLARRAPPADALRSAKLEMLRSTSAYRKPYFWGPFQVFTRSR